MTSLHFPNPSLENPWTSPSGIEYTYDGVKWKVSSSGSGSGLEEWTPTLSPNSTYLENTNTMDFSVSQDGKVLTCSSNVTQQAPAFVYPQLTYTNSEYIGFYFSIDSTNLTELGSTPEYYLYMFLTAEGVSIDNITPDNPLVGTVIALNKTSFDATQLGSIIVGDEGPGASVTYISSDLFYLGVKGTDVILMRNNIVLATYTLTDPLATGSLDKISVLGIFGGGSDELSGSFDINVNVPSVFFTNGGDTMNTVSEKIIEPSSYPVDRENKAYIITGMGETAGSEVGKVQDGSMFSFSDTGVAAGRSDLEDNFDTSKSVTFDNNLTVGGNISVGGSINGTIQDTVGLKSKDDDGYIFSEFVKYQYIFTGAGNTNTTATVPDVSSNSDEVFPFFDITTSGHQDKTLSVSSGLAGDFVVNGVSTGSSTYDISGNKSVKFIKGGSEAGSQRWNVIDMSAPTPPIRVISGNYTLTPEDNGGKILYGGSTQSGLVTIFIGDSLWDNFTCDVIHIGGGTTTLSFSTSGSMVITGFTTTLTANSSRNITVYDTNKGILT